jgi:two-component system phosphate regulon response regulator OmpR
MEDESKLFDEHTAHLLVVDDDTRIRTLLQQYLVEQGYRVTTASSAQAARQRMNGLKFDMLVLDVMMPGESGLDLTHSIREESEVPVLLLTAKGESQDRIAGLETGADDYLTKPFEPRELLLRINTILKRARQEEPDKAIIKMGPCKFDMERGELWRNDDQIRLTSAEVALLRLFAANPKETFSRSDLCEHTGAGLERSVDVQITRLRRKIESNPRMPVYLQTVRGIGYTLIPD